MQIKLLINTVDLTAYLEPQSFRRYQAYEDSIDRAEFMLEDHDGALPAITALQDVLVEKSDAATIRYFGGVVAQIRERINGLRRQVFVQCQDWTVLLDKALVTGIYLSASFANDAALITQLFTDAFLDPRDGVDLNEFDTATYVVASERTIPDLTFNRTPLNDAIRRIAGFTIRSWYIDYFKRLHYYERKSQPAIFGLSDAPDDVASFAYEKLERQIDGLGLANLIVISGGNIKSSQQSELLASDGVLTELTARRHWLAPASYALPKVERNDGTFAVPVWTELTVFVEDDSDVGAANDAEWNLRDAKLKFQTAPPNLANAIRVTGHYLVPFQMDIPSPESYAQVGRWIVYKIIDRNIFTMAEAYLIAQREIQRRRFGVTTYSCTIDRDGLLVGDDVSLTNAILGVSALSLTIESIVMRIVGGTLAKYDLTLRLPWV